METTEQSKKSGPSNYQDTRTMSFFKKIGIHSTQG